MIPLTLRVAALSLALVWMLPGWAQQQNPTLREQPQFDDPVLAADQERLNAMQTATMPLLSTLWQPGSPVCELSEEMVWLLNRRSTREDYEALRPNLPSNRDEKVTRLETVMTHGDCVNGIPNGEFTVIGRFETEASSFDTIIENMEALRVRGTVVNGQLQGEVTSSSRIRARLGNTLSTDTFIHSITRYEANQPVGRGMSMSFDTGPDGLQQVSTNVMEFLGPGIVKNLSWIGSMPAMEMTTVNGRADGWLINYPIEVVRGHRAEFTRTCYQHGQIVGEAVCGPARVDIADAVSGYPRPSFRRNPERDLLAALTTHSQTTLPGTREAFDAATSLCPVGEDALWAIAYGAQAQRMRAAGMVNRLEGKLLEGQCSNGRIEGPYHLLLSIDTSHTSVVSVTGTLHNGMRQGRLLSARTTYQDNPIISFGIAEYDNNQLASPRINFFGLMTLLEKPTRETGVLDVERFNGLERAENYQTVNGVRHGMSISYRMTGERIRRCYQNGQEVENLRACR